MAAANHSLLFSLVASVTAAFTCRLAWAVAWPRTEPATRFAALNHRLIKGFFFNQGLDMSGLHRLMRASSTPSAAATAMAANGLLRTV